MRLYRMEKYFLLFILVITGCISPGVERKPAPPPEPTLPEKAYSETFQERAQKLRLQKAMDVWEDELNAVIDSLQAEIEKNKSIIEEGLLPEDQDYISKKNKTLFSYQEGLKRIKRLQQKLNERDTALSREIIYLHLIDRYLTSLKLVEKTREKKVSGGVDTKKIEEEIENNYQKNDYYTVIKLYNQLSKSKPEEGRDLKSQAYYALSLARLGWTEDAIKVVEEALQEKFFIACENAPLFYELGEWLIDTEQYEVAQKIFRRIILYYQTEEEWYKKAKKKAALFRGNLQDLVVRNKIDRAIDLFEKRGKFSEVYRLCLEAQKNCPDLACQKEVQTILNQFVERTITDIEEKLCQIDEKIGELKFLEVQEMLSSLKESFPGEEYPPPIIEKLTLIQEKENILQGEEIKWKDEIDRQKLEKANNLLEREHYEEAIVLFDRFQGTPYQVEAETKKQLAIDRLARERRIKAGQFFSQATHSEDPELKKTYLIESYNLLKGIIDNYPNNSYAEKIEKNMEVVRSEIEKVYPEFFMEQEHSEAESLSEFFEGENSFSVEQEIP